MKDPQPTPEQVAEDIHNFFHPYTECCGPECKYNLKNIAIIIQRERDAAWEDGQTDGFYDGMRHKEVKYVEHCLKCKSSVEKKQQHGGVMKTAEQVADEIAQKIYQESKGTVNVFPFCKSIIKPYIDLERKITDCERNKIWAEGFTAGQKETKERIEKEMDEKGWP